MKIEGIKPYNITLSGDNDAEISLYGDVVAAHPTDWDGNPVEGNFIALDDFLRDLDELRTKDNITVHINSGGGDLYSGVSIYNRLKELPANVITVNDGLAASAASLIFQAGNTRRVHAGSNVMIHQAAGLLIGYYQSKDLKDVIKQLDAANKAAANIYAEASGRDAADIKAMIDRETWLTGQDAVDAGLADEVVGDVPVSMSLSADKSRLIVNGVVMPTFGMHHIPEGIPTEPEPTVSPTAQAQPAPMVDKTKGETKMEITNLEELRAAFPELLAQAETSARTEGHAAGVQEERARLHGIEAIQAAIADKALITGAKYGEKPLTAAELALQAMQAQAAIGATVLANMKEDAGASGTGNVAANPNGGAETTDEVDAEKEIADTVNLFNKMNGGKK